MTGIERIAAERKQQIERDGWAAHIHKWKRGELVDAAICYALSRDERELDLLTNNIVKRLVDYIWPFYQFRFKPSPHNRIRELEKAGALIAAEIDRLLRLEKKDGEKDGTGD